MLSDLPIIFGFIKKKDSLISDFEGTYSEAVYTWYDFDELNNVDESFEAVAKSVHDNNDDQNCGHKVPEITYIHQ